MLYFSIVHFAIKSIWKFDIFNKKYWDIISAFWDEGGVINSFQEYSFLFVLLAVIPFWIWGWVKANKLSVAKIIFFPFFWYNSYQERKYSRAPKAITLKNMGGSIGTRSPQQAMEDMIVHIIDINENVDLIDTIIRDNGDYILISIKYSGICINVLEDEEMASNIAILNNIAKKIDYSQILGLNNIVITIE